MEGLIDFSYALAATGYVPEDTISQLLSAAMISLIKTASEA